MSRRPSLLLAFAFAAPLALSVLSVRVAQAQHTPLGPQTDTGKLGKPTVQKPNAPIMKKPDVPPAANVGKPKFTDRAFKDAPMDNWMYAAVADLQLNGVLTGYPEGYFRGKRPLTYYELAVAVERILDQMSVLTLAADGKTLQPTFGIPHALLQTQAQTVLKLMTELKPELEALGRKPDQNALVARTLEAYINTIPGVKAPGANNPGTEKAENTKAENTKIENKEPK